MSSPFAFAILHFSRSGACANSALIINFTQPRNTVIHRCYQTQELTQHNA